MCEQHHLVSRKSMSVLDNCATESELLSGGRSSMLSIVRLSTGGSEADEAGALAGGMAVH